MLNVRLFVCVCECVHVYLLVVCWLYLKRPFSKFTDSIRKATAAMATTTTTTAMVNYGNYRSCCLQGQANIKMNINKLKSKRCVKKGETKTYWETFKYKKYSIILCAVAECSVYVNANQQYSNNSLSFLIEMNFFFLIFIDGVKLNVSCFFLCHFQKFCTPKFFAIRGVTKFQQRQNYQKHIQFLYSNIELLGWMV